MFSLASAILIATVAAAGQNLSVSGTIEKVTSPPACAPGATHRLRDVDVYLKSANVNLDAVPGYTQRFVGTDVGSPCPLVDVTSVGPAPLTLTVCNTPALGCNVTLDLCPSPGSGSFVIFASVAPGYAPINVLTGTFLLHPLAFVPLVSGAGTAVCQSAPLALAGPPSLIGVSVFFQVAASPATGAPLLSNAAKMTILPPTVPCSMLECY